MTQYREYAGLRGETFRVPAHTISLTSPHYDRGSYPFVEMAQRVGKERDRFALIALYVRPRFEDTLRDRGMRALLSRQVPVAV